MLIPSTADTYAHMESSEGTNFKTVRRREEGRNRRKEGGFFFSFLMTCPGKLHPNSALCSLLGLFLEAWTLSVGFQADGSDWGSYRGPCSQMQGTIGRALKVVISSSSQLALCF